MRATRRSQFVRRPLDPAKIDRWWAAIEYRRGVPRRWRRVALAAATGAVAAALLLWLARPASEPRSRWTGTVLTARGAPQRVRLADGSKIDLQPGARLSVCEARPGDYCLALSRGRAEFAVTKNKRRSFFVEAGAVSVRVVGTRFSVERGGGQRGRVAVGVLRGVVEVRAGSTPPKRLRAGEHWSWSPAGRVDQRAPPAAASSGRTRGRGVADPGNGAEKQHARTNLRKPALGAGQDRASQASASPSASKKSAERVQSSSRRPARRAPRSRRSAEGSAHRRTSGPRAGSPPGGLRTAASTEPSAASRSGQRAGAGPAGPSGVESLWQAALLARRAGRYRDEASAYRRLLARYPEDSRAPLAAFELGRLLMDGLKKPGAAIAPLERSLALGAEAPFREHALARLVRALDLVSRGDKRRYLRRCRTARARYLSRYPRGIHRRTVQACCTAPE